MRLEVGGWRLEDGGWRMEVGGWILSGSMNISGSAGFRLVQVCRRRAE